MNQHLSNIEAIIEFLGDNMTESQAEQLMDKIKMECSISEREYLLNTCENGTMYTLLSENNRECGGYSRY